MGLSGDPISLAFAHALIDLIEEADAMPTDDELAEITRLGREHPLPDDEARKLYEKVQAGMVKALGDPADDSPFQAAWRARITAPDYLDHLMADRARHIERGEPI